MTPYTAEFGLEVEEFLRNATPEQLEELEDELVVAFREELTRQMLKERELIIHRSS